ncbi:hypothetical protein Leryth_015176 [Lithospermum erythrorhizon]|nr:hypothetical protein Leryth_015176 [Lithospermum erythrorhizon]
MLRAKSRIGSTDLGHKSNSSIFSRSKLCRGDVIVSQIDSYALVSVDNKLQKRIDNDMIMQGEMEQLVEELNRTKEDLVAAEGVKVRLLAEIKKIKQDKKVMEIKNTEANELTAEVRSLNELLSNLKDELKQKDGKIKSLEMELENVKMLKTQLAARDSLIDRLRQELNDVRESNSHVTDLSAEGKRRIVLEAEVEKGKLSELKMAESLQHQTKLLEETKIELEEAKLELISLQKKVGSRDVNESRNKENIVQSKEDVESKKSELQLARDQLAEALDEVALVKNELRLVNNKLMQATGAEETSKKAMDELAIALKEVATESNQWKEKHQSTLLEMEQVKAESEQLKDIIRITQERYQKLLDEAEKEIELYRNTAERLRLEAEESFLAWNDKEIGFVACIKTTEEEKAALEEALEEAETLTRSARDENFKLRDILKQAINEANAAKAAASIARDENSLLKDSLSGKDEAAPILNQKNERLQIDEVANKETNSKWKSSSSEDESVENEENGDSHHPYERTLNSEGHGSVDNHHLHDSDRDRNNFRRKKLFHRVSDIIMRKKMIL